ncbi:MAG: hypothetical protein K1X89_18265 [Myxococcaceae bacterium]|nr:hypothetical protein [Myxococcaceae bacterium]
MRTAALALLLTALGAHAAERDFAFTWSTRMLAPKATEAFAGLTTHLGRVTEYSRVELRAGFAQGLAPGVETQVFFDAVPETSGQENRSAEMRVSNLWRLGILSPREGRFWNAAVQAQLSLGPQAFAVDGRLVGELRFGALLVAADAAVVQDAYFDGRSQPAHHLEQGVAVGYGLPNGVRVGLEWRNRLGFDAQGFAGDAVSMGPSLSGRFGRVWLSLAALPQVAAFKRPELVGNGEPLELTDNERVVVRLLVGVDVP